MDTNTILKWGAIGTALIVVPQVSIPIACLWLLYKLHQKATPILARHVRVLRGRYAAWKESKRLLEAMKLREQEKKEWDKNHQQDEFMKIERRYIENCRIVLASSMNPDQKQAALENERLELETRISRIMK